MKTILFLLLLLTPVAGFAQVDNGSNSSWIPCTRFGKKISCPRVTRSRFRMRVVNLGEIEGGGFFLRVAGSCLVATTIEDQDRQRFERLPTNIDCESGVFLGDVLKHRKRKGQPP